MGRLSKINQYIMYQWTCGNTPLQPSPTRRVKRKGCWLTTAFAPTSIACHSNSVGSFYMERIQHLSMGDYSYLVRWRWRLQRSVCLECDLSKYSRIPYSRIWPKLNTKLSWGIHVDYLGTDSTECYLMQQRGICMKMIWTEKGGWMHPQPGMGETEEFVQHGDYPSLQGSA